MLRSVDQPKVEESSPTRNVGHQLRLKSLGIIHEILGWTLKNFASIIRVLSVRWRLYLFSTCERYA